MYRYITLIPVPGDRSPIGYVSGDQAIPVLDLQPDHSRQTVIQFQPEDYDHAVEWLDHLADEASNLAAKIRLLQVAAEVEPEVTA